MIRKNIYQTHDTKTDEYVTPLEIIDQLGPFDLDPCSPVTRPWATAKNHYTILDDGRVQPWFGRVYVNPPYSNLSIWLRLMHEHNNGIALLYNRSDTNDFHNFLYPFASSMFLLRQRISFCNVAGLRCRRNAGTAPSVFFAFGQENSDKLEDSAMKGAHVPLNSTKIILIGISPTWVQVVTIIVDRLGEGDLKNIYDEVEKFAPEKVQKNNHWKAKIRQSLQVIRKRNRTLSELKSV